MYELQQYLQKYRTLAPPEASVRKVLLSVLKDECGLEFEEQSFTLQQGGVFVSCHPTVRSELLRMAPRILNTLHHVHNIRLSFIR
jgi:hypothetical protein